LCVGAGFGGAGLPGVTVGAGVDARATFAGCLVLRSLATTTAVPLVPTTASTTTSAVVIARRGFILEVNTDCGRRRSRFTAPLQRSIGWQPIVCEGRQ
jgi:hypothetical protein